MNDRLRNAMIGLLAVAWIGAAANAQQSGPAPRQDHGAHHREMMARGADAMGFDQERTIHHFLLYEDGGSIDVSVKEASDHATLQAIRQHLRELATQFKAGDFAKPTLTHAQQVPGTGEMTRLKDHITYRYEETPAGGRVRILTRDADAIRAVHAFLDFQIADHRTGDSGVMQPPRQNDPQLPVESDALRLIYKNHDMIRSTLEPTDAGIAVVQTLSDPNTVVALQQHAAEVTEFVKEGMPALHKAMMKNGGGMMGRGESAKPR